MVPLSTTTDVSPEYRLLVEAFESFTRASGQLESAYRELQKQAESLQLELEEKNRQLEVNLAEKERVKNYLDHILQSLPCGVVVVGADGCVSLENQKASHLMGDASQVLGELVKQDAPFEREMSMGENGGATHLLVRSTPLKRPANGSAESVLILTDITQVKKLEEENRRGERLRVIGEKSCQLAHEIRNPLGSIEIYASLLEKEWPESSESRRWATSILTSTRHLNNTLTNMLNFPKILSPRLERIALRPIVEECLAFVGPLVEQRSVEPQATFDEDGAMVHGDPELLKQMFLNLIFNAIQAMPRGGRVCVRTCLVPGEGEGFSLCVSVTDTGRGIPAENLPRIFDPFFTTNRNGNGLGLSIVHTIVQRHNGSIHVASSEGKGTEFTIYLPAVPHDGVRSTLQVAMESRTAQHS
ncbi:MAG: hypothetical protein HYX75_22325 [Acidobacteria bacterium]|nr:hypothetical protein [Acidobacteriota bacterium]